MKEARKECATSTSGLCLSDIQVFGDLLLRPTIKKLIPKAFLVIGRYRIEGDETVCYILIPKNLC